MVRRLVMTLIAALPGSGLFCPGRRVPPTPGDNGRIVSSAETSNGVQLFTVRPAAATFAMGITKVQGDAVHADWAPNGRASSVRIRRETHAGITLINPRRERTA